MREILSAAGTDADALAALQAGRAELIRLDARVHGRPVPIDALPATAYPAASGTPVSVPGATGERFLTVGQGTREFVIDRPEPGRPALVEVTTTGSSAFMVKEVVRTADRVETLGNLASTYEDHHERHYLTPDPTYLLVKADLDRRWSIRILPIGQARRLETECVGQSREVLSYEGGPALLTVQARAPQFCSAAFFGRRGRRSVRGRLRRAGSACPARSRRPHRPATK
ncbi:hypothetical protein ETD83_21305 [Actinomadura soli]|uniref:Uncharacterized protein n=1 Tax=Actinomadura soli TaxID=2508997 RepID=A0A5C4JBE5_9ACTN|nr:hypothetical protein [Actinomadura soli]TMQ96633.1 hypothetical protein ETD83_21305 [Actinomadura soli]